MVIIGIDPGYDRLGYGVLQYHRNTFKILEYGSIVTNKDDRFSVRLNNIEKALYEICKKYKIDFAAIEELFFNTNTKTAIKVAEARGVILNTLENLKICINEYTPLQIKQAVVGYGRADKNQVKYMVKKFLNIENLPKLDDTTDALAVAICHGNSFKYIDGVKEK